MVLWLVLLSAGGLCSGGHDRNCSSCWQVAIMRPEPGETLLAGAASPVVFVVWRAHGSQQTGHGEHVCTHIEHPILALSLQVRVDGMVRWTGEVTKGSPLTAQDGGTCFMHTREMWMELGPHTIHVSLLLTSPDNTPSTHPDKAAAHQDGGRGVGSGGSMDVHNTRWLLASHTVGVSSRTLAWPELKIHRSVSYVDVCRMAYVFGA